MTELYTDQLPTFSIEAERGLLGLILWTQKAFTYAATALEAEDFYDERHQEIYTAMARLMDKHTSLDAIAVSEALERKGIEDIDDVSTYTYLSRLYTQEMEAINLDPMSLRVETYVRTIAQHAEWRRLGHAAWQIMQLAHQGVEDATEQAESLVMAVRKRRRKQDFITIGDYFPQYLDRLEALQDGEGKVRGIATGFDDLDRVIGGLQRGNVYVPAARPGVGKTSIIQNFAYNMAVKDKKGVGFFSCEMSMDDLMDRFVSIDTKIDSQRLRTGDVIASDWNRLVGETQERFEQLGIYINHTPGITIDVLKSMARRLVSQHDIDVIMVDYLQLLRAEINGKRITPRAEEVAEIARQLKMLAGELNVPIIAPAQISRDIERRAGYKIEGEELTFKIPMLSDLRESGEIEQSSDVVMFLARSEEKEERVKLVVAKHRSGPVGELDLWFVGSETRFYPVLEVAGTSR